MIKLLRTLGIFIPIMSVSLYLGIPTVGAAPYQADLERGIALYNLRLYNEAERDLRLQATQGDPVAQTYLGRMYEYGFGLKVDEYKAIEWYEKAALRGNADAQRQLGNLYKEAGKKWSDNARALYWLISAAEQGNIDAQSDLADLYLDGIGNTFSDAKLGFAWHLKAARGGSRSSQYTLAELYRDGVGVEKRKVQSFVWSSVSSRLPGSPISSRLSARALSLRSEIMKQMTAKEISLGIGLALRCLNSQYIDCGD